jgi:hypothetical protein
MNQANKAKINMAAIHRKMSGRHSRQQSINSLDTYHHIALPIDIMATGRFFN